MTSRILLLLPQPLAPDRRAIPRRTSSAVRYHQCGHRRFRYPERFGNHLIHILPDSFQLIGMEIFLVAPLGFALPWSIHQWWHRQHLTNRKVVITLALLGLTLHGAMDGIALFAPVSGAPPGHSNAAWMLALAVILHRLPMALAIWWLSRPQVGRFFAILLFGDPGSRHSFRIHRGGSPLECPLLESSGHPSGLHRWHALPHCFGSSRSCQ